MSDESAETVEGSSEYWFAGKDLPVLIYKVNRRPLSADPTLFDPPPNPLTHLDKTLRRFGGPVAWGRAHQRDWRVGNLALDDIGGTLTGMVGWARSDSGITNVWDDEAQGWRDLVVARDVSAVAPFAFVADGRYLGVLRHPSFTERNVESVLTTMLNRSERQSGLPTVKWAVEPVGDEREFYEWLESVGSVTELKFVFERPNPDAEDSFQEIFARLDRLEAERIRETITARDREAGLSRDGLRSDPLSVGFIAAAMAAFGYVIGTAYRGGKRVVYDQRRQVLTEPLEEVASEWLSATNQVLEAVKRVSRRRARGADG